METAGSKFLKVARLTGLDENLDGFGTVQRVGLQPFFTARDPIRPGRSNNLIQTRIHVGDEGVPGQR